MSSRKSTRGKRKEETKSEEVKEMDEKTRQDIRDLYIEIKIAMAEQSYLQEIFFDFSGEMSDELSARLDTRLTELDSKRKKYQAKSDKYLELYGQEQIRTSIQDLYDRFEKKQNMKGGGELEQGDKEKKVEELKRKFKLMEEENKEIIHETESMIRQLKEQEQELKRRIQSLPPSSSSSFQKNSYENNLNLIKHGIRTMTSALNKLKQNASEVEGMSGGADVSKKGKIEKEIEDMENNILRLKKNETIINNMMKQANAYPFLETHQTMLRDLHHNISDMAIKLQELKRDVLKEEEQERIDPGIRERIENLTSRLYSLNLKQEDLVQLQSFPDIDQSTLKKYRDQLAKIRREVQDIDEELAEYQQTYGQPVEDIMEEVRRKEERNERSFSGSAEEEEEENKIDPRDFAIPKSLKDKYGKKGPDCDSYIMRLTAIIGRTLSLLQTPKKKRSMKERDIIVYLIDRLFKEDQVEKYFKECTRRPNEKELIYEGIQLANIIRQWINVDKTSVSDNKSLVSTLKKYKDRIDPEVQAVFESWGPIENW